MQFEANGFSFELSENKKYSIPKKIIELYKYGFYLIIAVDNGNWIVFENDEQKKIFYDLKNGMQLKDILEKYAFSVSDINHVVVQLEGHHFEVNYTPERYEETFFLRIYLTNNCNLRCKHCFMYASTARRDELTPVEIEKLIEESHKNGANKLILTGGEVVTSDSLEIALKTAKKYGMYTQILSNGTLWTESLIEKLVTYIDEIQVSIDGFNEETNAEIRGKGTFKKALEVVDFFVRKKILVSVVITPLYDYVEKYYNEYIGFGKALVKKYENDNFLIIFANEIINGRNVSSDFDKNQKYKEKISAICEEIYENNEITAFFVNHQYNRIFRNCGYGNLTVSSLGDFYFCGRIYDVKKYGHIRTVPFAKIMELRKKAREITQIDNISGCNNCELKYVCGGGCRIYNFPSLTQINDLDSYQKEDLYALHCTKEYKENIYRLMIETCNFLMWK